MYWQSRNCRSSNNDWQNSPSTASSTLPAAASSLVCFPVASSSSLPTPLDVAWANVTRRRGPDYSGLSDQTRTKLDSPAGSLASEFLAKSPWSTTKLGYILRVSWVLACRSMLLLAPLHRSSNILWLCNFISLKNNFYSINWFLLRLIWSETIILGKSNEFDAERNYFHELC